jgi:16S rRNA (cytosine1402-N4)-methyltransferase
MDPTAGATALDLIADLGEDELANVLYEYGEERRSRRIARSIKRALEDGELATTFDLRRAVVRAVGPTRVGGIDPATRTFQALRIAVNEEMKELEGLLASAANVLADGASCAILSFHSLEDRIVKHAFRSGAGWEVVTKKPRVPSEVECVDNPRARSAKLRVAKKRVGWA